MRSPIHEKKKRNCLTPPANFKKWAQGLGYGAKGAIAGGGNGTSSNKKTLSHMCYYAFIKAKLELVLLGWNFNLSRVGRGAEPPPPSKSYYGHPKGPGAQGL